MICMHQDSRVDPVDPVDFRAAKADRETGNKDAYISLEEALKEV